MDVFYVYYHAPNNVKNISWQHFGRRHLFSAYVLQQFGNTLVGGTQLVNVYQDYFLIVSIGIPRVSESICGG